MRRIVLTAIAALATGAAQAAPLYFDDFNDNSPGLNRTPAGWSVTNGSVDIVGPGVFPEICSSDGDVCVDLDGSTFNAGRMSTTNSFSLLSGQSYTLSFDYSWNYFAQILGNTMTYGVGSFTDTLTVTNIRSTSPQPYTPLTLSFIGDGSSGSIFFDHQGGDNGGIVIDNVSLSLTMSEDGPDGVVPVPASLPLLLAGLGAFAAVRRRRG